MDATQLEKIRSGRGFFAALDQSGGSTPKALADYGVAEGSYGGEDEMFALVHQMRTRVITNDAFDGSHILAAILFENTMDREIEGLPSSRYLWEHKQVVPLIKIDKGLAEKQNDVQLMKPIPGLDELLERSVGQGMFGTKMRSLIHDADDRGIAEIVDQQFELGAQIAATGLVPILEPEVSIHAPKKEDAESLLAENIREHLADWSSDMPVMLKLSIPTQPGRYANFAADDKVLQVVALSGGYSRDEACNLLAEDPSMIASFSRALLEGLSAQQTDAEFTERLRTSVEQIYRASTV